MDGLPLLAGIEPWHWLALGLVLLVAELVTGTTHLLWPALAAWVTGIVFLIAPMAFPAQLLVFGASTLALTWFGRSRLKGGLLNRPHPKGLNAPADDLIGRIGVAETAFAQGVGRVRLGDTVWAAQADTPIAAGQSVAIEGVEGATLKVRLTP